MITLPSALECMPRGSAQHLDGQHSMIQSPTHSKKLKQHASQQNGFECRRWCAHLFVNPRRASRLLVGLGGSGTREQ